MLSLPAIRAAWGFTTSNWYNGPAITLPRVVKWLQTLRAHEAAALPVGVAGFCWGGLHTMRLCHDDHKAADGRPLLDAAFTAHPSFIKIPEDPEKCTLPLSVCIGDADLAVKAPAARRMKAVLDAKDPERFEMVILHGAMHGFAVRGQVDDPKQLEHTQVAEDQAVAWFDRWLKK